MFRQGFSVRALNMAGYRDPPAFQWGTDPDPYLGSPNTLLRFADELVFFGGIDLITGPCQDPFFVATPDLLKRRNSPNVGFPANFVFSMSVKSVPLFAGVFFDRKSNLVYLPGHF